MKPSRENFNAKEVLKRAEHLITELTKSDSIIGLSDDKMCVFAEIRRISADLLMNEDQLTQAIIVVRQVLKLESHDRLKLTEVQKRIIQFTLEKIESSRERIKQTTNR
jgi:hypothetical protein